jgi:tetratricopeptide (TPR) repeat protein
MGLALHERSIVAYEGGEYSRAIRFAYDALPKLSGQSARDRVLADIAASFLDLGVVSAARDAFLVLAATAQEQYVRWTATLNLLELSVLETSEPRFESYRRELAGVQLPANLEVGFHLQSGKGYMAFGRWDRAQRSLNCAVELAAKHRLNQLLFSAEESLRQLEGIQAAKATSMPFTAVVPPESIADVAAAIHQMRTLVGAHE